MLTIDTVAEMHRTAERLRSEGRRIGFVPTMGSLHDGHLALIRDAARRSDIVVVSIFVNPTQFGPGEDFERYPRNRDRDRALAEHAGCDVLFVPEAADMYAEGSSTVIDVQGVSNTLEGAARPGHFRGVATVVAKLFAIVHPHVAVFGQKDAQQAAVIRRMVRDLNIDVELVVHPTVREADGLAMSSRNSYLTEFERAEAVSISRGLGAAADAAAAGERDAGALRRMVEREILKHGMFTIDYIAVVDGGTLQELERLPDHGETLIAVAARIGSTRLIDNVILDMDMLGRTPLSNTKDR